jgi:hypothetical protein
MMKKHRKCKKWLCYRKEKKEKSVMIKSLGLLVGGVFVGAVGAEILRKKCPETLDDLYAKTCEISSRVKEAFRKGYESAMQSQSAAKASA